MGRERRGGERAGKEEALLDEVNTDPGVIVL